jgi:hypothetical protein
MALSYLTDVWSLPFAATVGRVCQLTLTRLVKYLSINWWLQELELFGVNREKW